MNMFRVVKTAGEMGKTGGEHKESWAFYKCNLKMVYALKSRLSFDLPLLGWTCTTCSFLGRQKW